MTRRNGATLMEVLVAIFIMGIGLLSILAMFPLGALRMAQAVQDDRAGHMGLNGAAIAQAFNLRNDPNVTPLFTGPPTVSPTHPDYPGYPVYVDPIGLQTYLNPNWVGGQPATPAGQTAIPRTKAQLVLTNGALDNTKVMRWFTLTDDLKFGNDGQPSSPLQRENVLSYALLFRRPRSSVANVVEMSVAVYFRRPLSPLGLQNDEYPYVAQFNTPSTNMITLTDPSGKVPLVQPGSWILDATYKTGPALNGQPTGYAHGYFYRVVNVTQTSTSTVEVEVGTPLRDWPAAGQGTVILMNSVVEVLEKGTGW